MAVNVLRETCRRVSEPFGNHLHRYAFPEQEGSVSMPQIVKPDRRQPEVGQQSSERPVQPVRIEGTTILPATHEPAVAVRRTEFQLQFKLLPEVPFQFLQHSLGELHHSFAFLCFHRAEAEFPFFVVERVFDM